MREKADCILVLDQGPFVERGVHDQLMALNDLYARIQQADNPTENAP